MHELAVGRLGGHSSSLVEVSTGNILEPDFSCYAIGVDTELVVRPTEDQKSAIYLKGRRDPILKIDANTLPMIAVGSFGLDGITFVGLGSTVVSLGDLAEIRRQFRGSPLGW
jgi:hypothetical protein